MSQRTPGDDVPRTPSGEFDVERGTQRLIEILDKDKNGRVDAREIIDGIHNHPNKNEVIMLLRLHPDPENALGVVQEDAKDLESLKARTPRSNARIESLREELMAFKGSLKAAHAKKGKQVPSTISKHKSLIEILDKDGNGHVDAHELISMIREHPKADEVIEMVSGMHDPKHALGIIKAPSKYRRRSVLVAELNDAKKHLKHTRKRVGTLQQTAKQSQDLRLELQELKRMQEELKKKKRESNSNHTERPKVIESDSDEVIDTSSSDDPGDGDDTIKITRYDQGSKMPHEYSPSSNRSTAPVSALEKTLRKHTEDLGYQVKKLPALDGDTWKSSMSSDKFHDEDAAMSGLSQLLSPANHVFIGLWHRTKSTLGSWPLCLCGSLASSTISSEQKVHLGNYDSSSGVVWRFVNIGAPGSDATKSDGGKSPNKGEEHHDELIHALIECVDHSDFVESESGRKGRRLYLTSDLTLVDDFTKAANWTVSPYHHGSFRGGPGDISVYITLSKWDLSRKSRGNKLKMESRGSRLKSHDDSSRELVLCAKASTKEVLLVPSSKLSRHDPKTGLFLYDEAWELTPDAEAPMKESMRDTSSMIPLENYLDSSFVDFA